MATAAPEIYTLSLHDALPICSASSRASSLPQGFVLLADFVYDTEHCGSELARDCRDRKSTRLNSSHSSISYAVFCLKKKTDKSTALPIRASFSAIASFARSRT